MFIFTSLLYAEFYCILYESSTPPKSRSLMIRTVLSTVLEDKYNLTELQIGLCYLYVPILAPPIPRPDPQTIWNRRNTLILPKWSSAGLLLPKRNHKSRRGLQKSRRGVQARMDPIQMFTPFRHVSQAPYRVLKHLLMISCFLVGATSLGWTLEARAPLAAVLVMGFFVGLGSGTNNNGMSPSYFTAHRKLMISDDIRPRPDPRKGRSSVRFRKSPFPFP